MLDGSVGPEVVDEIVLLPVIDARPTPFEQVRVASDVGDATLRFLRERGYVTLSAERFRERPAGPIDLDAATAGELLALAPEDKRYFMLVEVRRLEPTYDGRGHTWDAQIAGVLVDRAEPRIVWRDVATATSTLGGALAVFVRGSGPYEASVNASRLLVESLPSKKARKRRN